MDTEKWLATLKEFDANRSDLPGEHLVVLGAGLLLLLASGRSQSLIRKALIGAAAGALIGRAASGTGGVSRLAMKIQGVRGILRPVR